LNPEAGIPDNDPALRRSTTIQMRHEDNETKRRRRANAAWPRRAVVGLWVLAFVVAGGTLVARWDGLMERLARPPIGESGGAAEALR
jgi:hypothetical protein